MIRSFRLAAATVATILLLGVGSLAEAGNKEDKKLYIGEVHTVPSKILGEDRHLLVGLPMGYQLSTDHYPVLYLLDGKVHFHHIAGLVGFLGQTGAIPQMIVVGVGNTDRNRDMTHTHADKDNGYETPTSGGAGKFTAFLEKEAIAYVDKNFRTQPYRILAGHCLAGTFTTHNLLTRADLFDAHLAIAPYLNWDKKAILGGIDKALARRAATKGFFYVSYAGHGEAKYDIDKDVETLKQALAGIKSKRFAWKADYFADEDHDTVVHVSIQRGLRALYSDWKPQTELDLAGLKKHYRKLSSRYGFEIRVPEQTLNLMAYKEMWAKKFDRAIEIFEYNVTLYPNSANVYDSLGEGYEAAGKKELARKNYQTAIRMLEQSAKPDPKVLQIYKEHLAGLDKPSKKASK